MKKIFKIILSIPIFIFFFLALGDILSGGEPLVDEFIIVFMTGIWVVWLKKEFKLPKFLKAFLIFLGSSVLHNVLSHLLRFEEPVFFFLALFSLAAGFILLLFFLGGKIRALFKKLKKKG